MAAAAWAVHGLLHSFLGLSSRLAAVAAILVAVVIYLILVLAFQIISREDLSLMPKGEKIAKILHIK
jgi:stage V sporulation protein B